VCSLIQEYGFNGADIDLENGVDPTYMASALEQLESDAGSSLIITLAPQTVDTQSAGSGYVDPSVVNDALDCLATQQNCGSFVPPTARPGTRGVMTWSINWDASNGYNFADTVAPYLATLP
jgi:chitinase